MKPDFPALVAMALLLTACSRRGMDVELPVLPPSAGPLPTRSPERGEIIVNIDQFGRRVVQGVEYPSDASLERLLAQVYSAPKSPKMTVVIRADRRTPHESVLSIVMMARRAGFSKVEMAVGFMADPIGEENVPLSF